MKISFSPKSRLGKWTVGFNILCILAFIFICIFGGILKVVSDIIIGIFGAISVSVSIIALITGIIAVIKNRERSVLIFWTILIGLFVSVILIGDIIGFPDINLPGF